MKKLIYPITIFVILELSVLTAITLWIIWYLLKKNQYEKLAYVARTVDSNIVIGTSGYASMISGIVLLFIILVGSTYLFIGWLRERLVHRQRADFFSGFTHELMTPITCIQMNVETMLKHNLEKDKRDHLLLAAYKEGQRLRRTIDNILEMSRIEYKRKTIQTERTDLAQYLTNYVARVADEHVGLVINFCDTFGAALYVMLDEKAFTMCLDNLLDNSLKYCDRPKIVISLGLKGRKAFIHFADNGPGPNKESINKIFKIFYRGDTRVPGSGLGLYITKNIVTLHKGTIAVDTSQEQTKFVIRLPVSGKC